MARKKKQECPNIPAWLVSFSDLMSLLLTFFILLYSMSVLDIKKLMKFLWYFQGEEPLISSKATAVIPPISLLPKDVAEEIKKRIVKILPPHGYQFEVIAEYVLIRLFNDITFEDESAELTPKAKESLKQIAEVLKTLDKKFISIDIQGHVSRTVAKKTDPWALSTARAIKVTEFLISQGVNPSKLSATGYGDTKPIYQWKHPLLERRNDRVEIYIRVKKDRKDLFKPNPSIDPSRNFHIFLQ